MFDTRTSKTLAIAASLCLGFLATPAFAAGTGVTEVAENVYVFDPGDHYNSMFIVTDEGVIGIESVSSQHAAGMLDAIKSVTDQPVKYLLQSHNHWDHASGGGVFREAGANIVAHEKAAEWLAANPGRDTVQPDDVWSGARRDITLGGTTVELHYMGLNHGLGMTIFRLPEERIVYIADLVTPNRVMFAIVPDFNISEWLRTLGEIEALEFETAVFSHSESGSPIGSKSDVADTRHFIQDLQGAVFAEFGKGTDPFAIPSAVKLDKYADWVGYDQWLEMNVWRIMSDMWLGPYPWVPE